MELLCPGCQKPLTIDSQYAGQMMKCPMCGGTFTAPALPGATPQPPVPATVAAPVPPVADAPGSPMPEAAPPPPMPPGDYSRKRTIWISPRCVPWIGPVALSVLFVLSFFSWESVAWSGVGWAPEVGVAPNLWSMAFTPRPAYIAYVVFTLFLAWPLSITSMLVGRNQIAVPSSLQMLVPLRNALVGGLALLGLAIFFVESVQMNLSLLNPSTFWMKLAFRVHLIAVVGFFLEYWLDIRKTSNLPPPKIEIHT